MCSEIKLMFVEEHIKYFNPIKLFYNDELIWDDEDGFLTDRQTYDDFWTYNAFKLVSKFTIEITHFHHSIVKIWGE